MLDANKLGIQYKDERPLRDAFMIYVFGEGGVREKDYFDFFENKSSRLKIKVFEPTENQSAPDRLLFNAEKILKTKKKEKIDEIWFVIDVDRYDRQDFIQKCKQKRYNVVVSNPSFEVWLYFHFENDLPKDLDVNWKDLVDKLVKGGFDSNIHPLLWYNTQK